MKKTRKKYLMILFLALSITILPMGGVKAALQANSNTHVKKVDKPTNWIGNIRKMEETNGSMGLNESLNIPKSFKEAGIDEKEFLAKIDILADRAFEDQCTTANPRVPLVSEIKQILLDSYYGK